MKTSAASVALAMILTLVTLADVHTPSAQTQPVQNPQPAVTPAVTSPPAVPQQADCHGPMYYRIKEEAEDKSSKAEARQTAYDFVVRVQPDLEKAHFDHMVKLIMQSAEKYRSCLASRVMPSSMCAALGSLDATRCSFLSDVGADACRQVLAIRHQLAGRFDAGCASLKDKAQMDTCRALADAAVSCSGLEGDNLRLCEALGLALKGQPLPTADPSDLQRVWIVAAAQSSDARHCDRIPTEVYREACHAMLKQTTEGCKPVRPLLEPVHRDFSCRQPVLATRLHAVGDHSEGATVIGNQAGGTSQCRIFVVARRDGVPVERLLKEITLTPDYLQTLYFSLGAGEQFQRVDARCTYDLSEGSYFVVPPPPGIGNADW